MGNTVELPAIYVYAYGPSGISSGLSNVPMPSGPSKPDQHRSFLASGGIRKVFANGQGLFATANQGDSQGALQACFDGLVGLTEEQFKSQLRLHSDCQKYMLSTLVSSRGYVSGTGNAGEVHYSTAYFRIMSGKKYSQKVIDSQHYDFYGTPLMPIAGIYYWLFGGGKTRYVNIGSLGLAMVPSDFKPVMDAVATKGPGTYAINDQFEYNAFRFMLNLYAAGLIGRISGNVSGTLNIGSDGSWQFDGYYTLKPDAYDADHSNRTYMQEKLTDFLRFLGDRFGYNNYLIVIEGSQKISFSGRK